MSFVTKDKLVRITVLPKKICLKYTYSRIRNCVGRIPYVIQCEIKDISSLKKYFSGYHFLPGQTCNCLSISIYFLNYCFGFYQMEIQRQRRALILALGVCYIARLEQRDNYINFISKHFTRLFALEGPEEITTEIQRYINIKERTYNECKTVLLHF